MAMEAAVFIDKDGTLIPDIPYNTDPDLIDINKEAIEGLIALCRRQYKLIIVSNQAGIACGYFEEEAMIAVENKLRSLLQSSGISLTGFYFCPHYVNGIIDEYAVDCFCRKPSPGMLLHAAEVHQIDLSRSWMIGDILNDVEAGNRAGCKTILIDNGNETEWIINEKRIADYTVKDLRQAAEIIIGSGV